MTHSPDIQFPMLFARLLNADGGVAGTYALGKLAMPPQTVVLEIGESKRAFRLATGQDPIHVYVETVTRFVTPKDAPQ
jgi:hypothetical protein